MLLASRDLGSKHLFITLRRHHTRVVSTWSFTARHSVHISDIISLDHITDMSQHHTHQPTSKHHTHQPTSKKHPHQPTYTSHLSNSCQDHILHTCIHISLHHPTYITHVYISRVYIFLDQPKAIIQMATQTSHTCMHEISSPSYRHHLSLHRHHTQHDRLVYRSTHAHTHIIHFIQSTHI